ELFISKNVISIEDAFINKKNNQLLILGVMISKIRKITTKKGENMAFLSIEDQTGKTEAIVFPRVYEEVKASLRVNVPALVVGKMNVRNGEKSIVVEKIKIIDPTKHKTTFDGITFKITPEHSVNQVTQLKKYIASSKGDSFVRIIVNDGTRNSVVQLKKTISNDNDTKRWMSIFPA
ncbi:MAG TPA: OB-fold nucleic acid binding domain-containing protein, partial [Candidatus Dojkabacteria bacterium]|nr:OB-fold nucleic acid binding domain-containing protein [Candidatus Dojkabacteria bacterium]